ncbi:L-aspartate oxidase [Paenibacillus wenxiniae]|uniref:L-aspartate oxidase n=1 Tax=Paenibacillus wenxiniae TaxID=1636843 RepID=A0ABW4RE63_9BACL
MPELQSTVTDGHSVIRTDVLIIGTGIAGLFTAIEVSESKNVLLITKDKLMESNTRYAQGGIAAVMAADDAPSFHLEDTLLAGAGLCDEEAVELLVQEGPKRVQDLIRLGTAFDARDGQLELTREGAHSHRRILHANGDSTGFEIVRALSDRVRQQPRIDVWEHHFTIELVNVNGDCVGAIVQRPDGQIVTVYADATVLCTGGSGQLYEHTTNPKVATADGIALAYRAGALLRDMEFIQFHPTALCHPGAPCFLISEAVRGEGAILRNRQGEAFMERYHPLRDLAPRDIVARAIVSEMEREQSAFVYLDITHEPEAQLEARFPTIYRTCLQYGIHLAQDWIPVAPAAHYMMGGIRTDQHGESTVPRLFACGEVSSTGIHGANRLASNSLSEAIVYGNRIARRIVERQPIAIQTQSVHRSWASATVTADQPLFADRINVNKFTTSEQPATIGKAVLATMPVRSTAAPAHAPLSDIKDTVSLETLHSETASIIDEHTLSALRLQLQRWMTAHAGIRRHAHSLQQGIQHLQQLYQHLHSDPSAEVAYEREYLELNNMVITGLLIMQAALHRQESRGGHYREDYPQRDDMNWHKHTIQHIDNGLMEETMAHV